MSDSPSNSRPEGMAGAAPSWIGLAATLVAVAALIGLASHLAFYVDDAFITFRYARNWSDWGVPLFNSFELEEGFERAEGYSNFLWMALLRVLHGTGADLVAVTPSVQLVIGAMTVLLVGHTAAKGLRLGGAGQAAAPLLIATAAPFVCWTTGGMETGLFTLLFTGMSLSALRAVDRSGQAATRFVLPLFASLVVLVRVEGLAWVLGGLTAVALASALAGQRGGPHAGEAASQRATAGRQRLAIAALVALCVFTLQLVYRRLVYDHWVPTTVTAKTGGGGGEVYARGLRQVASWGLVTLTPLFALALAPLALRHGTPRVRVAALAAAFTTLGFALYSVITGGDWMPYFRFLAPATPLLALLIAIGLDRLPRAAGWVGLAVLCAVQPLTLFDVHVAPEGAREALRFRSFKGGYRSERARIDTARVNTEYFGQLGSALDAGTSPGEVLAFGAIGSPGWYAPRLDFLDRNGLVTPIVARREVERGEGTAGHEKRVPHVFFLDAGEPAPRWLFAKLLPAIIDGPGRPGFEQAKGAVRQDGVVGRKPERELFERTTMRVVPMRDGPAKGTTLILLERSDPEVARAFWGAR